MLVYQTVVMPYPQSDSPLEAPEVPVNNDFSSPVDSSDIWHDGATAPQFMRHHIHIISYPKYHGWWFFTRPL